MAGRKTARAPNDSSSDAAVIADKRVDLLDAFIARCGAPALLWSIGELTLPEAVDKLQHDGERDGLDANAVQEILAAAFRPYREGEPS